MMGRRFEWKQEYNIGVAAIDREHQELFLIINKLLDFRAEDKDRQWICQEGIKYFKGHALQHFASEEAYMESIGYEGLERHRNIHNGFRDNTLPALEQEMERTGWSEEAVDHFLAVCAGWLVGHTQTEDQAIVRAQASQLTDLLSKADQTAIKNVIGQMMFGMFQLEPQLVSDAYGGERFGAGVYYRLVYGAGQGGKEQEILMALEEKLLVNTVGKILGLKSNKLDAMLVNAARYTARQFVGRTMAHFPSSKGYEVKEENLLSYEQFQAVFQRERPQVSLLFNTGGAGYFAYCVFAPDLLETGVGTPIEHGNAIAEVEKYLTRREEEKAAPKRKVLVVDDSLTIRQAMKGLLDSDYEVALAESGVAAIRAIALNRPDLVLLDYEMPVCDGKQTLEMLRSEPSFADVPVVFLTGRSDPEVVQRLLALKPAGYLLKHLKPEEIKQKIDQFFEKNG